VGDELTTIGHPVNIVPVRQCLQHVLTAQPHLPLTSSDIQTITASSELLIHMLREHLDLFFESLWAKLQ
jgi:hypothetical protein